MVKHRALPDGMDTLSDSSFRWGQGLDTGIFLKPKHRALPDGNVFSSINFNSPFLEMVKRRALPDGKVLTSINFNSPFLEMVKHRALPDGMGHCLTHHSDGARDWLPGFS